MPLPSYASALTGGGPGAGNVAGPASAFVGGAGDDKEKNKVPKFSGEKADFERWRFKMRAWLGQNKVLKAVDDGTLSAADSETFWNSLVLCCDGDAADDLMTCAEGKGIEAWRYLMGRYQPDRDVPRHNNLKSVLLDPYNGATSEELAKYIRKKRNLIKALKKISLEEILRFGILQGLPDTFTTANDTIIGREISDIEQIEKILMNTADRKDDVVPVLAVAAGNAGSAGSGSGCGWCGIKGHNAHECRKRQKFMEDCGNPNKKQSGGGGGKGTGKGDKKCHKCGETGHIRASCPKKGKN